MKILFLILILLISNAFAREWGVQIRDNEKKVSTYKPEDNFSKVPLKESGWNCFLSATVKTKEGEGRSIDCKYKKTKALLSAKLFCLTKEKQPKAKSTIFSLAEEGGKGFLFELMCQ